jgi:hypothetical protein
VATVQRYVDTASSGGDGTTQAHSGATAAYASLSSWEANAGGSATDDYIVDCAGSAADTTGVTVDFAVNLTTGSVTIRGDRAAPDDDGFYDGNVVISSSHYRLATTGNICLTISEPNVTVDGIQLEAGHTTTFRSGIAYTTTTGLTIRKNRIRNTNSTDYGIGNSSQIGGSGPLTIENNLVVGFDEVGIRIEGATHTSITYHVRHNTVYGDGASIGIYLDQNDGTGTPTFNIAGNAMANNTTEYDASQLAENGATVNLADNATDDTTGQIQNIVAADAWTSPGTTAASDFTVKNTSSALYNAVNPTLVSTDITDFTRDGTNHDVGAFEFQSGGTTANLEATEQNESVSASSALAIAASLSATEAQDAASASATLAIAASLSATEADDLLSASSSSLGAITADLAATEADDAVGAAAALVIAADAALTEAVDSLSASAALALAASAGLTEADDTLAASADASQDIAAELAATEQDDAVSASATLLITAAATLAEAVDALSASTAIAIAATAELSESDDTLSAGASTAEPITADLAATEADDELSASAAIADAEAEQPVSRRGSGGQIRKRRKKSFTVTIDPPKREITATLYATEDDDDLLAQGVVHESAKARRRRRTLAILFS